MNQKLWSGFTAATLLVTTLGIAPLSYADQSGSNDEVSEAQVPSEEPPSGQVASASPSSTSPESEATTAQTAEAVKVGEYQSEDQSEPEETITELVSHQVDGRQAVTLYVRNIPVLTFLGSDATSAAAPSSDAMGVGSGGSEVKVASVQNRSLQHSATERPVVHTDAPSTGETAETVNAEADSNAPVWRATTIAARLNQFHRDNVNAETITAVWDPEQQRYLVKVGDEELVGIDSDTILPNSTQDTAQDTLQVTNLLRRQLGNAPPIESIAGDPQTNETRVSVGPFEIAFSGMASWYGPGFDGNYSASGEVFNQNAMTAAHRTLPFGTQVRVTNMDNGLSVVVRINDRGPFHGDRVIDVSTAAAEAIGLVNTGVAPVNLEVLGTTQSASY
jgi:rare lipoprotein A